MDTPRKKEFPQIEKEEVSTNGISAKKIKRSVVEVPKDYQNRTES